MTEQKRFSSPYALNVLKTCFGLVILVSSIAVLVWHGRITVLGKYIRYTVYKEVYKEVYSI